MFSFCLPRTSFFRWSKAVEIGVLGEELPEASGLAVSSRYPGRLYHINDSAIRQGCVPKPASACVIPVYKAARIEALTL